MTSIFNLRNNFKSLYNTPQYFISNIIINPISILDTHKWKSDLGRPDSESGRIPIWDVTTSYSRKYKNTKEATVSK